LLLSRCQKEFEIDIYKEINYDLEKAGLLKQNKNFCFHFKLIFCFLKAIDEEKDEIKRKEKLELLDDRLSKAKRRYLGNIR
jgi:hypothetical protein